MITCYQMTCGLAEHKWGDQKSCTKTLTTKGGADLCLRRLKTLALTGTECVDKKAHQEKWRLIAAQPDEDVLTDEVLDRMIA